MHRPLAALEQCEVQRDGAVVRHTCMTMAPDGYAASNLAGSAIAQAASVSLGEIPTG